MNTFYKVTGVGQFFTDKEEAFDVARLEAIETNETIFVFKAIRSFTKPVQVIEEELTEPQVISDKEESAKAVNDIYGGAYSNSIKFNKLYNEAKRHH